ncbi:MAG: PD-(D/E)XK nuclease family protein, partial [Chloroflexi bacterium]|nr:PD-(D/E)XK nuclease family protein [Chloroflexota bacterium]
FARFFDELQGAIDAASYRLPVVPGREEILVADVVQARGVDFRAVAVLGLAEGEFPATLGEDAFLRDVDRARLHDEFDLQIELSTESAEAEFFYETITRPRERLLLTRPRLADNGAVWQASPFWEEVRRLVAVEPQTLTSESLLSASRVASWVELMESLASAGGLTRVRGWIAGQDIARLAAFDEGSRILALREGRATGSPHDGDLSALQTEFARRLGPDRVWSASRLESYRACPFMFFVGNMLSLEPRQEPAEGHDVRQLGNIYHHILERVYLVAADPGNLDELLAALPAVAGDVLDAAPQEEGFRETAWWRQTRGGIVEMVRRSIEKLAELQGSFIPLRFEARFGLDGEPVLVVGDGADLFRVRGLIDRVDRALDGSVRVIDYKTAGPSSYTKRALVDGKKIQVPIYALAARDALRLGEPVEGFYWHVQHAEPSGFTMSKFEGGAAGAMDTAVAHAWEAVRGSRAGRFVPEPPTVGCPPYCPAAGFCWRYRPGYSR